MSIPDLPPLAAELYRSLLPFTRWSDERREKEWTDEELGWPLASYVAALASMFTELDDLVRTTDDGPGYSALLDADRAPLNALPWLGQFIGVTVDTTKSDAAQRAQIRDEAGFRRGRPASMVAAAQTTLTDTKTVMMTERYTSAYRLRVRTFDVETPDIEATRAALISQKPAGIVLDYDTVATWTWRTLRDSFADWQAVNDWYADWQGVKDDDPTHP